MTIKKIAIGINAELPGHQAIYDEGNLEEPPILKKMLCDYAFLYGNTEQTTRLNRMTDAFYMIDHKNNDVFDDFPNTDGLAVCINNTSSTILTQVNQQQLRGYILKSRSPETDCFCMKCCPPYDSGDMRFSHFFISQLQHNLYIPVIETNMLNCSYMADQFIRLTWLADDFYLLENRLNIHALTTLFSRYKILLMAYSPSHYKQAGHLLGTIKKHHLQTIKDQLYVIMFDGFNRLSCHKRHTNALMHIQGYFRKKLPFSEKKEMTHIIQNYADGLIPLSVPISLIRHYLERFPNDYLLKQNYLTDKLDHYHLKDSL